MAHSAVHMVTIGVQEPGRAGPPLGHLRWHQPGAVTPLPILTAHLLPTGLLSLLNTLSRTVPGVLVFPTAWVAPWAEAWVVGTTVMVHHLAKVVGDLGDLQANGLLVRGRAGGVEAYAHQVTGLVGLPAAGAVMHHGRAGPHAPPARPLQAPTPLRVEVLSRLAPAMATRLLRRATPVPPTPRPHLRLATLHPRMSLLVRPVLLPS
jgi:hypothetical protein